MSLNADSTWLPSCYHGVPIELCDEPVSVDLEISRWLHNKERQEGKRPTVIFRRISEHPNANVLGNPYPRSVMLAALGVTEDNWLPEIARRLSSTARDLKQSKPSWQCLSGLDSLPVLRHRPGDAGHYITAGVTVTRSPATGRINLGIYRIQVVGPRRARIFFDPKTDAYKNWQESLAEGSALPVAIFLGANPVYMLVAASRLAVDEHDFDIAARLINQDIELDGDPPVPADSHYVILGSVTDCLESEGPFGEFKGYYVEARQSPVLEIHEVLRTDKPIYPAIISGAESGLTLMALQNEYLLYDHLKAEGFPVGRVRYLVEGLGEFVTFVESDQPCVELVRAAMNYDTRTKVIFCGPYLEAPWTVLATYGFEVHQEPYIRKGKSEGQRVGIILNQPPSGSPVEF